jgi:23S rRNA (adenine2503-C2)-methyltransferase
MGERAVKILARAGTETVAMVYLAEMRGSRFVEFVESVQPPLSRSEKWVLIISTLFGCPVDCEMCDAGGSYQGEPAFNDEVLEVLSELPRKYRAPGLMPSLSTIAPRGCDGFFDRLKDIKNQYYPGGHFQLQFSIHTTDESIRDRIIPVDKWNFSEIADYGGQFFKPGDRKITLNFALADHLPVSAGVLESTFDPGRFVIKITPVNPTLKVREKRINNLIVNESQALSLDWVRQLRRDGYEVIVSIGEMEENKIGSNCGQYIRRFLNSKENIENDSYQYQIEKL